MILKNDPKYCYFSVCDNNYVPHFLAMITSFAEVERDLPFFLVQTDLTSENLALVKQHADSLGIDFTVFDNPGIKLSDFAPCGNYPEAVWLKYYIDELFPRQFDRILYVDPDMLILKPLNSIFQIDTHSKPLGAVIDMQDRNNTFKYNLGIPPSGTYFNTGVILYDRGLFKELNVGIRAAAYAKRNPEKITYIDQCAFNATAWRDIFELDKKWNLMAGFHDGLPEDTNAIHFCAMKPWENAKTPGIEMYIHYRNKTPTPFCLSHKLKFIYLKTKLYDLLRLKQLFYKLTNRTKRYDSELIRRRNRIRFRKYFYERY